MALQHYFRDFEGLGKQHARVVPYRLVHQSLGHVRNGAPISFGQIRLVVQIGEYVACRGAEVGSRGRRRYPAGAAIRGIARLWGEPDGRRDVVWAEGIRGVAGRRHAFEAEGRVLLLHCCGWCCGAGVWREQVAEV
jgi:hypothetical protein